MPQLWDFANRADSQEEIKQVLDAQGGCSEGFWGQRISSMGFCVEPAWFLGRLQLSITFAGWPVAAFRRQRLS